MANSKCQFRCQHSLTPMLRRPTACLPMGIAWDRAVANTGVAIETAAQSNVQNLDRRRYLEQSGPFLVLPQWMCSTTIPLQ